MLGAARARTSILINHLSASRGFTVSAESSRFDEPISLKVWFYCVSSNSRSEGHHTSRNMRKRQYDLVHEVSRQNLQDASALHSVFTSIGRLPYGVRCLLNMRKTILDLPASKETQLIEQALFPLVQNWFTGGCLHCVRLMPHSEPSVLEKVIKYEQVHAIHSQADLHQRLGPSRRVYALIHSALPEDIVAVVNVALVPERSSSIQDILHANPTEADERAARGAIFYSISNGQKGLAKIPVGGYLIKRATHLLMHDAAVGNQMSFFTTLSPIPGFRKWIKSTISKSELFSASEAQLVRSLALEAPADSLTTAGAALSWILQHKWNDATATALKPLLMRLCCYYLTRAQPPDPVAHFHLGNGASIWRINYLADRSEKGHAQSASMMVNYDYALGEMHHNQQRYRETGTVAMSNDVAALLRGQ